MHASNNCFNLFYAVGCNKIDDNFFSMINASTFGQAPGTEILIMCNTSDRENSEIIYSTCQGNGRWVPDPSSGLCPELQGNYSYNNYYNMIVKIIANHQ